MTSRNTLLEIKIFVQKNHSKAKFGVGNFLTTRLTKNQKKSIRIRGRFLATETKAEICFQGKHRVMQINTDPGKFYGLGWVGD